MAKPRSKFKKVKWLFGKEIEIPEEWEITAQFAIFVSSLMVMHILNLNLEKKDIQSIRIQNR